MPIPPKTKLADYVIEEVKKMLQSGELQEGSRLPNQSEFAKQLGVSRLSLREAFHTLQLMGVIEQKPKVGTIIISGNPEMWAMQMTPPFLTDTAATMELLQARRFIETTVSKLAFFNIRTNELEKLNDILHAMEQAIKDKNLQAYAAKDIEFHMLIASASQNRYLVHMYIIVVNLMDQFIEQSFEVLPAMALDSIKHHKAIYKSLYEHNEVAFQSAIKSHLDNIITAVANYYAGKK